jgi:hypothetical protein
MITVRPLRADEGRIYLEIVNSAIRGLAGSHYSPDVIAQWTVPITDEALRDLALNTDGEIRLVAELGAYPQGSALSWSSDPSCVPATFIRPLPGEAAGRRWCERSSGWPASMA